MPPSRTPTSTARDGGLRLSITEEANAEQIIATLRAELLHIQSQIGTGAFYGVHLYLQVRKDGQRQTFLHPSGESIRGVAITPPSIPSAHQPSLLAAAGVRLENTQAVVARDARRAKEMEDLYRAEREAQETKWKEKRARAQQERATMATLRTAIMAEYSGWPVGTAYPVQVRPLVSERGVRAYIGPDTPMPALPCYRAGYTHPQTGRKIVRIYDAQSTFVGEYGPQAPDTHNPMPPTYT